MITRMDDETKAVLAAAGIIIAVAAIAYFATQWLLRDVWPGQ